MRRAGHALPVTGSSARFLVTTIVLAVGGYLVALLQPPRAVSLLAFSLLVLASFASKRRLPMRSVQLDPHAVLLGLAALFLILLLLVRPVQAAAFTEWALPGPGSRQPRGITVDGTNTPWFVEWSGERLAKLERSTGALTEYSWAGTLRPWGAAFGGGTIWFTASLSNQILGFAPPGPNMAVYNLPVGSEPRGIAWDPNGNAVWFAEYGTSRIGKVIVTGPDAGKMTEFTSGAGPNAVAYTAVGPGGKSGVWFTEFTAGRVGFMVDIVPGGPYRIEWPLPSGSRPWDIKADPLGFAWFSLSNTNKIARLDPFNNVTSYYTIPNLASRPYGLVIDSAGSIWIADNGANRIWRLRPTENTITEFIRPGVVGTNTPWGIAADSSTPPNIWFTDEFGNMIGVLDQSVATTTTTVPSISRVSLSLSSTTSYINVTAFTVSTTQASGASGLASSTTTGSSTAYTITETISQSQTSPIILVTGSTTTTTTTVTSTTTSTSYVTTLTATATTTQSVGTTETTTAQTTTLTSTVTLPTTAITTTAETETTTSTHTVTTTQLGLPPIPGFPVESMVAGLIVGFVALVLLRRRRTR